MRKIVFSSILTVSLFASALLHAANFNPASSAELQADLTTAATNNDPAGNTITLNANATYSTADNTPPNTPFTYDSANDSALTIQGAGMGSTILDGASSSQVMKVNLSTAMTLPANIVGITFRNGNSTTTGAGLLLTSLNANLSATDCEFLDNVITQSGQEGGGAELSTKFGTVTFTGNHLTGNQNPQGTAGGVLMNSQNSAVVCDNNIFTGNTGGDDGGAFVGSSSNGTVEAIGNLFTLNGASNSGGALEIQSDMGSIACNGNTFIKNTSDNIYGGAHIQADQGDITVDANTFTGNIASGPGVGGIIVGTSGNLSFTNNILNGNQVLAGKAGGAFIYLSDTGNNFIVNNTVTENQASDSGGGLLISTFGATGTASVYNNIVFNNQASAGFGQDIFFDNTTGPMATFLLFNNDFSEFCEPGGNNCDFAALLGGNQGSNISKDPLFVDAAQGNFQLSAGSLAINAGDLNAPGLPATDHDGNPRVLGGGVDMGALETGPSIAVNPNPLDFGEVSIGQEKSLPVTISNNGGVALNVSGITLSGSGFTLDPNGGPNPCGSLTPTVQPGSSCTLGVIFDPNSVGSFSGILTVNSDDTQIPSLTFPLTGIGSAFNISGGGCSLGTRQPPAGSLLWLLLPSAFLGFRLSRKTEG